MNWGWAVGAAPSEEEELGAEVVDDEVDVGSADALELVVTVAAPSPL